jgi:hypothetical protein
MLPGRPITSTTGEEWLVEQKQYWEAMDWYNHYLDKIGELNNAQSLMTNATNALTRLRPDQINTSWVENMTFNEFLDKFMELKG